MGTEYDLSVIEEPITLKQKDGSKKEFILREGSEDTIRQYRNIVLNGMTIGPDGKPSKIQGMADLDGFIVSQCLFECNGEGEALKKPVGINLVRSWPRRVVKPLAERAKEISDIDQESENESEETVKNESSDTTTGSE